MALRRLPRVLLSAAASATAGPPALARTLQLPAACGFSSAAAGHRTAKRVALTVLGVLGTGGVLWAAQSDEVAKNARLAYLIPTRLARDVFTAASIVIDYKLSLSGAPDSGPDREAVLQACHARGAQRLLRLCFANGGIYTKLGQHIGQLDHLMPAEYVVTMRDNLLDKCPVSSWQEVATTIKADLGAPPEELFASVEHTPIASASLAQVHLAHGHDGKVLAVKVQHAGLRESCSADVHTIEFLVHTVQRIFPEFNYQWLVDEIKDALPKELNFANEALNAERCRANLMSRKSRLHNSVHVPEIVHDLSTPRVLTMEYIAGVPVTDRAALARIGVDAGQLAQLVARTFNEMIFTFGFVHCDPHAANMLVRKVDGRMQLVLLDHGLYKEIDDTFRSEYAHLWRSLIFADPEGIKRHSEAMNAGELYPLFAAMLTQRPWDQIIDRHVDHLSVPVGGDDRGRVHNFVAQYHREIGDLLIRMPRPLLLLLKTNDCLRAVDRALGQPVNTFVITARECSRALAELEVAQHPGVISRVHVWWEVLQVEARLAALRLMSWWAGRRARRELLGEVLGPMMRPDLANLPPVAV